MIDSTNPRQLADNIRKLWDKFKSISGDLLPSRSTATTGQILKLTGENKTPSWVDEYSYTPPAYSETEVDTGQKWIDDKSVYRKVFSGTTPNSATPTTLSVSFNTLINVYGYVRTNGLTYVGAASNLQIYGLATKTGLSYTPGENTKNQPYNIIVEYTKPDPAPETRDDDTEAPEEKKTTRKKTTK